MFYVYQIIHSNFDKICLSKLNFDKLYCRSYNFDNIIYRGCNFGKNFVEIITSARHIYGDDQSGRVPQRELQHIGSIIHQNVMIFLSIIVLI